MKSIQACGLALQSLKIHINHAIRSWRGDDIIQWSPAMIVFITRMMFFSTVMPANNTRTLWLPLLLPPVSIYLCLAAWHTSKQQDRCQVWLMEPLPAVRWQGSGHREGPRELTVCRYASDAPLGKVCPTAPQRASINIYLVYLFSLAVGLVYMERKTRGKNAGLVYQRSPSANFNKGHRKGKSCKAQRWMCTSCCQRWRLSRSALNFKLNVYIWLERSSWSLFSIFVLPGY